MSYKKERRPVLFSEQVRANEGITLSTARANTSTGAYFVDEVQSLTGASTGTQVTNYGVTYIISTGSGGAGTKVFTMAAPTKGLRKSLVVRVASTKSVSVRTPTSDAVFFAGTTKNTIQWATGSTYASPTVSLIGLSTVLWAIEAPLLGQSTATNTWKVALAGATA